MERPQEPAATFVHLLALAACFVFIDSRKW
jgi:hypothetical protein